MARVEKATDKVADAMSNVRREQAKYDDLVARGNASRSRLVIQSERLATARRRESSAIRDAARASSDAAEAIGDLTVATTGAVRSASDLSSALSGLAKGAAAGAGIGVLGGLAVAATGVADTLIDVGKAVVTATQTLWLLPAAATAAGAGFAALKIGTLGFGDAMKDIRDPEKFAQALQSLSPNAQQAALSIRQLLPQFDALKNSVQDSLFANVAGEIQRLSNQFLPMLQSALSGVASAFNTAFQGVAGVLSSNPEMISNVLNNVQAGFQNAAQAAAPFTEALLKVTQVGSSFLPQLGTAIADAATEFSAFISNAAETGQLKTWIEDGISAVKELGGTIWDIGKVIYDTFGSAKPGEFKESLENVVRTAELVAGAIDGIQWVWDKFSRASVAAVNTVINSVNNLLVPLRAAVELLNLLPGVDIPVPQISPVGVPVAGTPVASPGAGSIGGGASGDPFAVTGARAGVGVGSAAAPWSPMAVPSAPAGGGRSGGPKLPDAPVIPYDATVPGGSSPATFAAESSFLDARQKLAEKRARLDQLEKSSEASADDRLKARNDVVEAERDLQGAEIRLAEARQSAFEKQNKQLNRQASQLGEIGAQLDQDFGISKGLSGIAENITKFVANVAAAPLLGQLSAVSQVNPTQGGHGLMGILGAQGVFGPQYQNNQYAQGASAMGPAALRPGGAYPGDAALLANVPAGRYAQVQAADLTQGLGDCSSAVEDLVNIMDGRPTGGRSMATGNASEWLTSRGFLPGMGGAGDFRVGFNSGHMQATLPGGTNFNWGSDASAAQRGVDGGSGAYDPSLTSHFYRPAGGATAAPTYAPLTAAELTNPALTSPTPLTGVPSMGGGMLPGIGMPSAAPFANTQYGGITPTSGTGKGGVGMSGGGALGMAMQAGGMALDAMAPGAGQAAQMGIKLLNRGIEYGGQVAGIGAQGLMETFLPTGGSELANNNWITRIVGGLAGAAPALPNLAGKSSQAPTKDQVNAVNQGGGGGGQPASQDNSRHITVDARGRNDGQGIARDIDHADQQRYAGPGM
ncbi:hypothetical protein BA059_16910 [Mycolicibacterium sp. (ex Dasyatis americana)]|nr:hypothetical protein BA059_16910 [Mycolicibacterium sp. (ex Dasyatis americana)]